MENSPAEDAAIEKEWGINLASGTLRVGTNPFESNFASPALAMAAAIDLWAREGWEEGESALLIEWWFRKNETMHDEVLEEFSPADAGVLTRILETRALIERADLEKAPAGAIAPSKGRRGARL